jgi:glycosyltransferase involved in cell wall biosynthesis
MPYFSIIMPTFNRAKEITRAIQSCLTQGYGDYEIIVIDDGSTDCTRDVVLEFGDSRICLISLTSNRGQNPARNVGIARASGEWVIMLDSDMALLPGALADLYERTRRAANDVGNVASSCKWDTGLVTPFPDVPSNPIAYEEYLTWIDRWKVTEYFNCLRRTVFDRAHWVDSRGSETCFHLAVASHWRISISRQPAIEYFTDSEDRVCRVSPHLALKRLLAQAPDFALQAENIIADHGHSLKRFAPGRYAGILNVAAMSYLLMRERRKGLAWGIRAILGGPLRVRNWATLGLGLVSPGLLAQTKVHWDQRSAALLVPSGCDRKGT